MCPGFFLDSFILPSQQILHGRVYCYSHFMDKETEAQRGEAACPRSHSSQDADQVTYMMARSRAVEPDCRGSQPALPLVLWGTWEK